MAGNLKIFVLFVYAYVRIRVYYTRQKIQSKHVVKTMFQKIKKKTTKQNVYTGTRNEFRIVNIIGTRKIGKHV